MGQYQACFINEANSIVAIEKFEASDDVSAIAYARATYPSGTGKGYELWEGSRHFHSASYESELHDRSKLDMTLPLGETVFVGKGVAKMDTHRFSLCDFWKNFSLSWRKIRGAK